MLVDFIGNLLIQNKIELNGRNNVNKQNCQSIAEGKSSLGLKGQNCKLAEIAPRYAT